MSIKNSTNNKLIIIGEKIRANTQFDIPYRLDRYEAMTALFEKKEIETEILCHNLYKPIFNV